MHRAYAARGPAGEDVVVVDVENASTRPFALALVLRPAAEGEPGIDELEVRGSHVLVDGSLAVVLPSPPGRVALADGATGDVAAVVRAGGAGPAGDAAVRCPDGLANGALLFPLAHTASIRVVLPWADDVTLLPERAPSADQVASGWATHAGRAARVEVPERRVREALAASTTSLLLAASGPPSPAVPLALDALGFTEEAAVALAALPDDAPAPGQGLRAIGRHWDLTRDADWARASVSSVATLVAALGRTSDPDEVARGRAALGSVADLLAAAGEAARRRRRPGARTTAARAAGSAGRARPAPGLGQPHLDLAP